MNGIRLTQPWFSKPDPPKVKRQTSCDLCGGPLGDKYWVGMTNPEIRLGAITCNNFECFKWLHEDHRYLIKR
jgi:hypothetical protein